MVVKKWHIYRANLDPVVGSEQGKSRPVLVLSEDFLNDVLNCVNIIPLTSLKPGRIIYPNEVFLGSEEAGTPNESVLLCHQIRTLDKRRLSLEYGEITSDEQKSKVINAICFQLGIK